MRDWFILLSCTALALAGILAWNVWAFNTISQGGIIGSAESTTPSSVNSASLDAVRAVFANRAAEEEKYRTGAYRFADPSQ